MIYYITGINARNIQLEYLYKQYENIRVYDASNKDELSSFYTDISNVSIFLTNDLIVLKRCEKLKNFNDLLEYLSVHKDVNKSIVIDYYCEYKGKNPHINAFKKIGAEIINIEDAESNVLEYVKNELKITKVDAKKILDIIGTDYNHVKNEVFKYKTIVNKDFSIDKIYGLMLENQDKKVNEYLSDIYNNKIDFEKIPREYYMQLLYSIYKDFEIFHKLNILKLSKNYNEFKEEYKQYENLFKLNYYVVYLKYKNLLFDKTKCLHILKKCNELESKLKSGLIDDKIAIWNIIKEIQSERNS